ncbi:MAG: hypothetical protein IIX65_04705 [Lachnospiraceae bacterium]|nr:hypothetical protein [Lachnospiraceae bacterium]
MKKALTFFLCILLLTGCAKAPAVPDETISGDNQVPVLCAEGSNLTVPLGARSTMLSEVPTPTLVAPMTHLPDNIFLLSGGIALDIANTKTFSEADIVAAANALPVDAFDNYRQIAVRYDESSSDRLTELLTAQYGPRPDELQMEKQMLFQAQMIPGISARIDALCAPGQSTASLDTELVGQLTNYFRFKLREYNDAYAKLTGSLGSSDRVKTEWFLWQNAFSAQEASLKATYTQVESDIAIRSVAESGDYLIIGLQEQLHIDYRYAGNSHADRMAYSINHALVLQLSDKGYQVVRDFYSSPILGLDTTEGIDRFLPAEAQTLIWLVQYDEAAGQWRPAGYAWETDSPL